MDVYMQRMTELANGTSVTPRMKFMLQDLLELRKRNWQTRNVVPAPTTIAQIHENAAKEKAAADRESFVRQQSMSRGGSRRGGDRNQEHGPDGWTTAGGSGAPRPPSKAGDLSHFGKINKPVPGAPMSFGPTSVFNKKGGERPKEPVPRTNMFSMLSQGSEPTDASKTSRPPSRAENAEAGPSVEPPTRKRLVLQPRSKIAGDDVATPPTQPPSEEEDAGEQSATATMSEADAKKKIEGDIKEFFHIRKIDEAVEYFTDIPSEYRHLLVDKLVSSAIESKATDAQLVADLFSKAIEKDACSADAFEQGFSPIAELLDDIAIDAPKAFDLMAVMLKGAHLDKDLPRRDRIATKSMDSEKLISLLS
jgi:translation initiation factor 4G